MTTFINYAKTTRPIFYVNKLQTIPLTKKMNKNITTPPTNLQILINVLPKRIHNFLRTFPSHYVPKTALHCPPHHRSKR